MMRFLRLICAFLSLAVLPNVSALSSTFQEISPLKAAMLTKNWQGLLLDVDQKVGVVPELGGTSVGVQRFGPELARRKKCANQFQRCYEATFAMAAADKNEIKVATAKRLTINQLLIDGIARGPRCKVYACLTTPATIAVVEGGNMNDCSEWSVLMLIVNPTERNIEAIVTAEKTMLEQLCTLTKTKDASLRLVDQVQETLAGNFEALGLTALPVAEANAESDESTIWYRCDLL